jgi:hypothetical protein
MSQSTASDGLKEVIGRALIDSDYRNLLFEDRPRALKGSKLSPADLAALDRLDRKTLEAQAAKLGPGEIQIMIAPEPSPKKPKSKPKPKPTPKPEPSPKPKPKTKPKGK